MQRPRLQCGDAPTAAMPASSSCEKFARRAPTLRVRYVASSDIINSFLRPCHGQCAESQLERFSDRRHVFWWRRVTSTHRSRRHQVSFPPYDPPTICHAFCSRARGVSHHERTVARYRRRHARNRAPTCYESWRDRSRVVPSLATRLSATRRCLVLQPSSHRRSAPLGIGTATSSRRTYF